MLFLEQDFSVRIVSVQRLRWGKKNTAVAPRSFSAISFRLSGNARFSDGKTVTTLADSDLLFMPAGVGYHLECEPEEIIVVHFEITGIAQDYYEKISPLHPARYEGIFQRLYDAWQKREEGYYLKSMAIFYELLTLLYRHRSLSEYPAYQKIRASLLYLESHYTEPTLDLTTLCRLSNLSDTYFRRCFFEVHGTTPLDYINRLRVARVEELIETGYYSVEEIAGTVGFSDAKYFSTVFKKYKGMSPQRWKKQKT